MGQNFVQPVGGKVLAELFHAFGGNNICVKLTRHVAHTKAGQGAVAVKCYEFWPERRHDVFVRLVNVTI